MKSISKTKLAAYTMAAGAAVLAAPDNLSADIQDFGNLDGTEILNNYVEIDINGDQLIDFYLSTFENTLYFGTWNFQLLGGVQGEGGDLVSVAAGEMIHGDAGYTFDGFGQTHLQGQSFFAFSYDPFQRLVPTPMYGYFEVGFDGSTWMLYGGAYETAAGSSIMAGAASIPEPGGIGLMAAGAAAIGTWRRRRKQVA